MNILSDEAGLNDLRACVALGMFDGVHLGHIALLKICTDIARRDQVPSVVYTYSNSPHPQKQSEVQGLLTTAEEKLALCAQIGITTAVVQQFTPAYRSMTPEAFVQLLIANNRVSTLICGHTYRFGLNGKGDAALLTSLGKSVGIDVICVNDLLWESKPISSTRIRMALLKGECEFAGRLLGRPYSVPVCFEKQRSAWPKKARVGQGNYLCTFFGQAIRITVGEDGTIRAREDVSPDARCGDLAFIQKEQ